MPIDTDKLFAEMEQLLARCWAWDASLRARFARIDQHADRPAIPGVYVPAQDHPPEETQIE